MRLSFMRTQPYMSPPTSITGRKTAAISQPGNFGASCQPVDVAGFRVYPPDETAALFASYPGQTCSAKGLAVPTVRPVQPG